MALKCNNRPARLPSAPDENPQRPAYAPRIYSCICRGGARPSLLLFSVAAGGRLLLTPANRPNRIRLSNQKRHETNPQYRMVQRSPKILPHRRPRPRIIRRSQQRQHVQQSKRAGPPHPNSQRQRNPNRQLPIRHQKRNRPRMWQHKPPQNRRHERIRPTLQKLVNPKFKSPVQSKLRSKNFVLPENQKQYPHANPQKRQRPLISAMRITVASHGTPFRPPQPITLSSILGTSSGRDPSDLLQLRIPLNKLLRPAPWKTHAHPPAFLLPLNAPHCPHAILRMPHLAPKHPIALPASLHRRPPKRRRCRSRRPPLWSPRRRSCNPPQPPRRL